jgi:hypothetical protein
MAKRSRRTPGKGVITGSIGDRVREAADELYASADAVVVIAVRFSGSADNDETIVRCSRGSQLAMGKALDQLYDRDEREAQIFTDDVVDEEPE